MQEEFGLQIPETLEEACDPRRGALLVYDMQVGVLRQVPERDRIVGAVARVLDAARRAGVRVFFFRHMSLPKNLAGVFQLRQAMTWQRVSTVEEVEPWFLRDSPAFPITPELEPAPTEAVVDKITMSAFEGTPLDIALRDCGVNVFVVVGVALEIGIEPTVRHGTDLGYIPVVVADACGAGDEEAGRRTIDALRFTGDAFVTDTDTICGIWRTQLTT
ncbi:MAG TPA: cysteine hydrolase [Acidimicrobiia bacterium]|nr:cysteine hydrolase [Acidimicrobiia bacterium]